MLRQKLPTKTFNIRVRPTMKEVVGSSETTVRMSGNMNHIPDPIFTVTNVKMTNVTWPVKSGYMGIKTHREYGMKLDLSR
jgi:hypothetical protein